MKGATIIFLLFHLPMICLGEQSRKEFFQDRARGWFWYEEKSVPVEEIKTDNQRKEQNSSLSPYEMLKEQGKNWENSLAKAVIDPSAKNIQNYLTATKRINEQAQRFSSSFKEALWINPEYDYSLENPVNADAIVAQNENDLKTQNILLRKMAKSYGLVFFFSGSCPHCHRFSPILKKFANFYNFSVVPVTINGEGLPEFPRPHKNFRLGSKLNVSTVPAIFLVEPHSNKVAAVSYGYTDWTTLSQKMISASRRIQEEIR